MLFVARCVLFVVWMRLLVLVLVVCWCVMLFVVVRRLSIDACCVLLLVECGLSCVVVRCLSLVGHISLVVGCNVVPMICYLLCVFVVCWFVCCLLFGLVVGCLPVGQFGLSLCVVRCLLSVVCYVIVVECCALLLI